MKNFIFLIAFTGLTLSLFGQNPFTPQQFLGYHIGEQFTRHHRVVDYFYALHADDTVRNTYGNISPSNLAKSAFV